MATKQWHQRATVQHKYCLWDSGYLPPNLPLARGHSTRKRWSWDSNLVQLELCQAHTALSFIQFLFQLEWNPGPAFLFLQTMESLWLNSFDQIKTYAPWSKQAVICSLNSYLIKKSSSQGGNKVCKEIALLKHTFNLHCQIARLPI